MTAGIVGTSQVLPQQGAVAPSSAGAAQGQAAPSLLTMRFKLLDVNQIAALMMQAEQSLTSQAAAGAQTLQQQLTPEQQAALAAPTVDVINGTAQAQQSAAQAWATPTANQTSTRSAQQASQSSSTAKYSGYNYWNVHLAQFRGTYNADGPTMAPNCGPTSVTMALRLAGLDVPGANGSRSNDVITQARLIATGRNDLSVGTTDSELERVVDAAGGKWSESTDLAQLLGWVQQGVPVVLAGNPINAWDRRYSNDQVYHFDGGHWVTISGYDSSTGYFIVNDPLSQIGPIYASAQELQTYFNTANGRLGIAVYR